MNKSPRGKYHARRESPTRLYAPCLALICLCAHFVTAAGQSQTAGAQSQSFEAEADKLNSQVIELYGEGKFTEAIPLAERALALREKAFGPEHPDVATSLNNLAALYKQKREYSRALAYYQRSLTICEKTRGPDHTDVARTLSNLGVLFEATGDYAHAEPVFKRALSIREKALSPDDPDLLDSVNWLAGLYKVKGDYAQSERLFQRVLSAREKSLGPEHPAVASALNELAVLYDEKGDYARAAPLLQRAVAIDEKSLGPDDPHLATHINNLAEVYTRAGDYKRAASLFRRALDLSMNVAGPEAPLTGIAINNLANLFEMAGDYTQAEQLYKRSLSVCEKAEGPYGKDVGPILTGLAVVYLDKSDYVHAEPLLTRALAIAEKLLGPENPRVADALHDLALLYEAKGDVARAVQFKSRAMDVSEHNLSLVLATGSERQKMAYLTTLTGETRSVISLHARSAPSDPQALRLALTTILRRKGRALDAMADQIGSLRRRLDPKDLVLLDQLLAAQSQLSALTLAVRDESEPQDYSANVAKLEAEIERLQGEVSSRSAEFRAQTRPVTIEQVQKALPADSALVEFYSYKPFNVKAKTPKEKFGARRYIAYVLKAGGEPLWADLGEAQPIDDGVARLRAALKDPARKDVKEVARALDELAMRPVRKLVGDARHVFVSADGSLNLVPFAALVDESGEYLVEDYSFTYLTSGRDLLRLQVSSQSRQQPFVVADPLFDPSQKGGGDSRVEGGETARRSADMSRIYFGRLPGTAEEAKAVGLLLPGASVLTQAQATESALKRVSGPSVLHVATHGFFLPDQPLPEASEETRGMKLFSSDVPRAPTHAENPLLRSGLALEGANSRAGSGGEDGILTALEAAGLDLWGTKLVVLSACETGVGEVKNGEGVYGLRRALVLAGSESQVMSLWQVSDEATRDLMTGYYKRLQAGEGRTEALRQVQLGMLRGGGQTSDSVGRGLGLGERTGAHDYSHPFFWAAFIQSGDWRAVSGQTK